MAAIAEVKVLRHSPSQINLLGELVFETVEHARMLTELLLKSQDQHCHISLAGVTRIDSAALSYWLCCQRSVSQRPWSLEFVDIPENLLAIAALSDLPISQHTAIE